MHLHYLDRLNLLILYDCMWDCGTHETTIEGNSGNPCHWQLSLAAETWSAVCMNVDGNAESQGLRLRISLTNTKIELLFLWHSTLASELRFQVTPSLPLASHVATCCRLQSYQLRASQSPIY